MQNLSHSLASSGGGPVAVKLVSQSRDPRHVELAERFTGAGLKCEWTKGIDAGPLASVNLLCCSGVQGDALQTIMANGVRMPIVLLCDQVEEVDRILALEFGADDVFEMDQSPREMIARLRAILRRVELTEARSGGAGGWVLRPLMRSLIAPDGRSVILTHYELQVTLVLIQAAGGVVTRERMIEELYSGKVVRTRSADTLLCRLRKKLSRYGLSPIQTLRGGGYYLDCPVEVDLAS